MKNVIIILLSLLPFTVNAQTGTIRGSVYDKSDGEPLIGVTVLIKGTTNGTVTDLEGKYSLKVASGTHQVQFSYISFQTITIEDVEVKEGAVTELENIRMVSGSTVLDELIVTAEATRNSETALMSMKKKSVSIMDGISAEKMEITGDANAGEAAKRVTGVTIDNGKYVYVRGLGDRYTKTTLNGVDIPGLDPDRNSIQMDIFPTSLIDNLIIRKNFTADMSAEFTGGILNVETKTFPDKKFFTVSGGLSYNPSMHFNPNNLTYKGGSTDFLGFDDGTRALPTQARSKRVPTPISGASSEEVTQFVNSFTPTLGAEQITSLMDFSLGLSFGNQIEIGKGNEGSNVSPELGYIFSLTYRSNHEHFDDVRIGEYQRFIDPERSELRYATIQEGKMSKYNVMAGALGGLAYKTGVSKIRFTTMHLQNGESTAAQFLIDNDGAAVGQSGYTAMSDNLEYNQRSLTNLLLNGTHYFEESNWELDWRLSPTLSTSDDPDIRKTAFTHTPSDTFFSAGAGGNPTRIWRSLNELNATGKINVSKDYKFMLMPAKLRFGGVHTYKERDYEILFFDMQFFGNQDWTTLDPSLVLQPENIYPNQPNSIYYQSGNNTPNPNAYNSSVNNSALYISNELSFSTQLKTIIGLRVENYVQTHTGRDQSFANGDIQNGRNLVNEKVLESLDLFPSAILIYSLSESQNLRASYSRTIARPSFKELSFAQILDPISNRIFNGALYPYSDWDGKLVETRVDNIDLRWELFLEAGQIFSVSAFYKVFDNPIELVRIPEQQTSTEYQPRNVGTGQLYGIELEIRKKLDFIHSGMKDLYFDWNATFVSSSINMTNSEYNSRLTYKKTGQVIDDTRQMAGQSPYVLNIGLGYNNQEHGLDAGLYYNVKGRTLEIVGGGLFPDIYTEPFHSLNFGINKMIGKNQKTILDLKVSNILDDRRESYYHSYKADPMVFNSLNPGRAFSIGVSHRF